MANIYVRQDRVMMFLNHIYKELEKYESIEDIDMLRKSMSIEMDYLEGKIKDLNGFADFVVKGE